MDKKFCPSCGKELDARATMCPNCGAPQPGIKDSTKDCGKNKITAGILAILLGGFGVHKFYLGQIGWGIVYLLFCWTGIPEIIGLIEGIIYLTMNDQAFCEKYGKK
ncbi:MAG: TM2 domain-containing protein [candidate division WOR-3 bacterium]